MVSQPRQGPILPHEKITPINYL